MPRFLDVYKRQAEDYTYLWYMYTTYGMSSLTSADTLSLEKNLDTEITCIPGDYSLSLIHIYPGKEPKDDFLTLKHYIL